MSKLAPPARKQDVTVQKGGGSENVLGNRIKNFF
jgi:hypothetical protein